MAWNSAAGGDGLYHPRFEHDNCGFGLIANIDGQASHWLVDTAIQALERMTHRGAVAADGKSGDGCGLLLRTPELFLRKVARHAGIELDRQFATGMVFMDTDESAAARTRAAVDESIVSAGLSVAGWRPVPVNLDACGEDSCPIIAGGRNQNDHSPNANTRSGFGWFRGTTMALSYGLRTARTVLAR